MARSIRILLLLGIAFAVSPSRAGLSDLTQTPNLVNEGIAKSLAEQVGEGRGRVTLPGSSLYLIARDPFRSIRRGRQLSSANSRCCRVSVRVPATASVKTSINHLRSARDWLTVVPRAMDVRAGLPVWAVMCSRVPTVATRRICSASVCRKCSATR